MGQAKSEIPTEKFKIGLAKKSTGSAAPRNH